MSDTDTQEEFDWAASELKSLAARVRSCQLATVSAQGEPLSSYAPVWIDHDFRFYVYVSGIAKHYAHLRKVGRCSLSLIDDESASPELFARKRLTVDATAERIDRNSTRWSEVMDGFVQRHGDTARYLQGLTDFDLFCLSPSEGRLVLGFGKAYRVSGPCLSVIGYLGSGGHRSKS